MSIQPLLDHLNATHHLRVAPSDLTESFPLSVAPARDGRYLVAASPDAAIWHEAVYSRGAWHGAIAVPLDGVWRGLTAPMHPGETDEDLDTWALCTLTDMRERTLAGLRDLRAATEDSVSTGGDEIDRSDARCERESAMAARAVLARRLADIDAALQRVAAGEYGICPATGEEIPRSRLRANPLALHTVDYQARLEVLERQHGRAA